MKYCPYSILELKPFDIENEQIFKKTVKSNYRRLALKYHPDRFPNDPSKREMFEKIK